MIQIKTIKLIYPTIALLLLIACSSTPEKRAEKLCPSCQYTNFPISPFPPLKAYFKNASQASKRLHIYLEGDGITWVNYRYPAKNPSSKQLLALKLMNLDTQQSIYINRPCYGYSEMPPSCDYDTWTFGRYSPEVIRALNKSIDEALKLFQATEIVLMGHSGGGTLAMLLAQKRRDVSAVITLASNLDHEAWSKAMGFAPLHNSDSLNNYPILPASIVRIHYAAGNDQHVPAHLIESAAQNDPLAKYILMEDFDHHCCWHTIWPNILKDLNRRLKGNEITEKQK